MERYGLNPAGKPLYRVVWSDSRTYLLGGDWNHDGGYEVREAQLYEGVHAWILEKWQSALDFAGPKEVWDQKERDRGNASLGPYPAEGEFVHAYTFPIEPDHSMISILVRCIEASRNLTPGERKQSIMDPLLKRKERMEQRIDDVFVESQPSFRFADAMVSMSNAGAKNIHVRPAKRIKDMQLKISAEETGLPMTDNAFFTGDPMKPIRQAIGDGA